MTKPINTILGIGIAIIIFLFFILTVRIIYPQPDFNDCWEMDIAVKPTINYENLTQEELEEINQRETIRQECYDQKADLRSVRNNKVFLTLIIVGVILLLAIIPLYNMINIAVGVGAAGIALIVYGFAVGWQSSADYIKLISLFITASIIIGLAVWINIKENKK